MSLMKFAILLGLMTMARKYKEILPEPETFKDGLLQVLALMIFIYENTEEALQLIDHMDSNDLPETAKEKDLLCKLRKSAEQIRDTIGLNLL